MSLLSAQQPKYNRDLDPYPWPLICRVSLVRHGLRGYIGKKGLLIRPLPSAGDCLAAFYEVTYFSDDGSPESSTMARFVSPSELEQIWWTDGPPPWNASAVPAELVPSLASRLDSDRPELNDLDAIILARSAIFTAWLNGAVLGTERACVRRARRTLFDLERGDHLLSGAVLITSPAAR